MNVHRYSKDLLSKETTLKLYQDISITKVEDKIRLIIHEADIVRSSFDDDVFQVKLNNQIGFCYWEVGDYQKAITHFEKVIDLLNPEEDISLFFLTLNLLIKCNRLTSNYEKGFHWSSIAFNNIDKSKSPFEKLHLLTEYAGLVTDSKTKFDDDFIKFILDVINQFGMNINVNSPIEAINEIHIINGTWNRKYSEIILTNTKDIAASIELYEEYKRNCPIEFYKNLANEKLVKLKSKL
ncbi:tetratricopeptide repeat protein [Marinigracilibium pacificum]|uniref:Tetratricopeptide repeat protein n=1 Tax=Marinigracilibium pacificum TaxID=2729599 RepID=A0A848IZG4_9BACT|nr:tetratricopeptide repeat protein [Marinigracilibium pacificum]NMM47680.1 hypothetical protein [Marinigracilibium pacificum]